MAMLAIRRVGVAAAPEVAARARSRVLAPAIRAFKDSTPAESADKKPEAAGASTPAPAPAAEPKPAAPAHAAAAPAPLAAWAGADLAAPARLSSLFDEMEREMGALTRAFFGDDMSTMFPFGGRRGRRALRAPAAADPFASALAAWPPADAMTMQMPSRLAVDVVEADDKWTVSADVPGMGKDDVKVSVHPDGTLTIVGERASHKEEKDDKGTVKYSERSRGRFARAFALPEGVDVDNIKAAVKEGVVTVTLPKTEVKKPAPKEVPVDG